jgi:hypothetical protein
MAGKLASELIAASKEEGAAFKKKEDTLRMAEANKAELVVCNLENDFVDVETLYSMKKLMNKLGVDNLD